jgi:hypothetical protein
MQLAQHIWVLDIPFFSSGEKNTQLRSQLVI